MDTDFKQGYEELDELLASLDAQIAKYNAAVANTENIATEHLMTHHKHVSELEAGVEGIFSKIASWFKNLFSGKKGSVADSTEKAVDGQEKVAEALDKDTKAIEEKVTKLVASPAIEVTELLKRIDRDKCTFTFKYACDKDSTAEKVHRVILSNPVDRIKQYVVIASKFSATSKGFYNDCKKYQEDLTSTKGVSSGYISKSLDELGKEVEEFITQTKEIMEKEAPEFNPAFSKATVSFVPISVNPKENINAIFRNNLTPQLSLYKVVLDRFANSDGKFLTFRKNTHFTNGVKALNDLDSEAITYLSILEENFKSFETNYQGVEKTKIGQLRKINSIRMQLAKEAVKVYGSLAKNIRNRELLIARILSDYKHAYTSKAKAALAEAIELYQKEQEKGEEHFYKFSDFDDIHRKFEISVHEEFYKYEVGSEGLADSIIRLLTGTANMVSRLMSTYKLVYRSFQDMKYTELHRYKETNPATIYRIHKQNFVELADVEIPIPKGMTTTYPVMVKLLVDCLQMCDMVNRSKSFVSIASNIESQLTNAAGLSRVLGSLNSQQSDLDNLAAARAKIDKFLSDKDFKTKSLKEMFSSMSDVASTEKMIDDGCKYEYAVGEIYKNLQKCTLSFNTTINKVRTMKVDFDVSKSDLIALSGACANMAKVFDLYGVTIRDFNRVEHNFVEVYKTLDRALKDL